MRKKVLSTAYLLIVFSLVCKAQVHGFVKDGEGTPLPGANLIWMNTGSGVTSNEKGAFSLDKPRNSGPLVVSFIGYDNDTITVADKDAFLEIILGEGLELSEVSVTARRLGIMKLRSSVMNEDMITSAELSRAACCNLGESFVTNPSVDVSYSDAATGAKQIKLLGLSGTYVQMLTENIPNYRGAASPYSLGYVPGPWMQSIQVSKGTSSVKNGYEAIAGQINVEYKKPQTADVVSANLFASSTNRFEANADASLRLSPRWSTMLLAHYENETKAHDSNNDGFADIPQVEQGSIWNRWAYMGDNYVFQAGIKALIEERRSGQVDHKGMMSNNPYLININTNRYEAFTKNAYIFNKEKNTNLALILSGTFHDQDAGYGNKLYEVEETNVYASLLFETELSKRHSLSTGLSYNYDGFNQEYRLGNNLDMPVKNKPNESVTGAYAQYTFNYQNKLILMAGLRGDYSDEYDFFVTPRAHIKYNPNEFINFRLSAGKGYRTNHILAENNYLMASSRSIKITDKPVQEEAWNYGASVATYLTIFDKTLNLNAEYFYTDFKKQIVVDMDTNPYEVSFVNLDGKSYSHVFQVEASYPFFDGFSLTAAYRLSNVKSTYNGKLLEKPLTSKYKGLLTASYQTPLGLWQFDATLQLNGGGRMPNPYLLDDGTASWKERYGSFEQVSAQVTRYFRRGSVYVGGENLTNFKQKNPIISASDPWGKNFDSTMIWGPMHGTKFYIGVRFNLERD
ncbi:TonB-dependent receptor domain-containing protein [Bacteroides sp. 519]|uniref:TonB-dependent receptor n=1 Tax=Bacteroides sp. 519 TaxID=2302937 RepID=UPI0013D52C47|nr:TonB-dependent receptor [Bacteroides sp. 519]NDV58452.1 TonB-dependent receptor [Bacteroides sp. 519]